MPLTLIPDIQESLRLHLLDSVDIVALVGQRISSQFQGPKAKYPWPTSPSYAIRVSATGAGAILEDTARIVEGLDLWCYGATGHNAKLLYRTVRAYLMPAAPAAHGFRGHGVVVYEVSELGPPPYLLDDENGGWPARVGQFVFDYSSVLAPP